MWYIKSVRNAYSAMPVCGIISALQRQLSNEMVTLSLILKNVPIVEHVMPLNNTSARYGLLSRCDSSRRKKGGKLIQSNKTISYCTVGKKGRNKEEQP